LYWEAFWRLPVPYSVYVDSLDISSLNLDLPDGRFVANIWSKKDVDTVLDADLKRDRSGYGNLEVS
jgi:hypothetical protein